MGMDLMAVALTRLGGLNGNAHRVLLRMCYSALDKPNEKGDELGVYFAGWEPLSITLGCNPDDAPPGSTDPDAGDRWRMSCKRKVMAALSELVAAGLVERCLPQAGTGKPGAPRAGQQQRYRLNLDLARVSEIATHLGDRNHHPPVQEIATQVGGENPSEWVVKIDTPRKKEDRDLGLTQDITGPVPAQGSDRASESASQKQVGVDHGFEPDPHGLACVHCQLPENHQRHRRSA